MFFFDVELYTLVYSLLVGGCDGVLFFVRSPLTSDLSTLNKRLTQKGFKNGCNFNKSFLRVPASARLYY